MISADGRYPNRRNASHCSVDFIDNKTKKIVALGMADKKSMYHRDGVTLSSNMLESMCFERAVSQSMDLDKVSLFAIDGDNKNKKFFARPDIQKETCTDIGHLNIDFHNIYIILRLFWKIRKIIIMMQ